MTKRQQLILVILIIALLGVTALLAVTLLQGEKTAQESPTLAALPTAVSQPPPAALPTWTPVAFRTAPAVEPTWTLRPTRTPPNTNTPKPPATATPLPTITRTFAPTFTPQPTITPTVSPTATQTAPSELVNPGFEGVSADVIPGWSWWAEDNFTPGGPYNPDTSFDTPLFKPADDPVRRINGPTLQIDATQHLKFKVHVFQTVPVSPTMRVGFEVTAGAYSGSGVVQLAAGIDPAGGSDCSKARWSDIVSLNQDTGAQRLVAPRVTAGPDGRVTVCLYAEPLYAAVSNAAFFDDAALTLGP